MSDNDPSKLRGPLRREKSELSALSLSQLKDNTVTDFDLYLDVAGHLVLYAPSPYRWSRPEVERLHADGFIEMYYEPRDESKVRAYRKIALMTPFDETLPPHQRINVITDAVAELTRVLFDHPISPTLLDKGRTIAKSLTKCVMEDPTCVKALGKLAHHDYYTYYHSARVAAYSLAIALKMSLKDADGLEQLATGCLFHDVGKSRVGLDILHKNGPLSIREWGVMKQHPEYGSAMIEPSDLGIVPREIILHHHERMDGRGYPHALSKNEILTEVKVAAFADVFDALTTNRPYALARTRFEALDFIRFHLEEQIYQDAYRAMVEILATDSAMSKGQAS